MDEQTRKLGTQLTKRAGDGIRTHDNDVGNVVLYQLSYARARSKPESLPGHRIIESDEGATRPLAPLRKHGILGSFRQVAQGGECRFVGFERVENCAGWISAISARGRLDAA